MLVKGLSSARRTVKLCSCPDPRQRTNLKDPLPATPLCCQQSGRSCVGGRPTVSDNFLKSALVRKWRQSGTGGAGRGRRASENGGARAAVFEQLTAALEKGSRRVVKHRVTQQTKQQLQEWLARAVIHFEGFSSIDGYVVWSDSAHAVGSSSDELLQRVQQNRERRKG